MTLQKVKFSAKFAASFIVISFVFFSGMAILTNVPTAITIEDAEVFKEIGLRQPDSPHSFEQQIALIRKVQYEVFKRAPLGEGIPEYEPREPADLMRRVRHGLCYDRSRAFDKAFSYLGMESRHVYLLYKQDRTFFSAVILRGQSSHAVTEVRTSKGWMFVDSNTEWIALTRQGNPVNADEVWRRYGEFDNAPEYLQHPWWAIRGLYSRKGQFYAPYIPFPELNWVDFLEWAVLGQ